LPFRLLRCVGGGEEEGKGLSGRGACLSGSLFVLWFVGTASFSFLILPVHVSSSYVFHLPLTGTARQYHPPSRHRSNGRWTPSSPPREGTFVSSVRNASMGWSSYMPGLTAVVALCLVLVQENTREAGCNEGTQPGRAACCVSCGVFVVSYSIPGFVSLSLLLCLSHCLHSPLAEGAILGD
jgi:hypothetical protein